MMTSLIRCARRGASSSTGGSGRAPRPSLERASSSWQSSSRQSSSRAPPSARAPLRAPRGPPLQPPRPPAPSGRLTRSHPLAASDERPALSLATLSISLRMLYVRWFAYRPLASPYNNDTSRHVSLSTHPDARKSKFTPSLRHASRRHDVRNVYTFKSPPPPAPHTQGALFN